jgi:hypothetical protein
MHRRSLGELILSRTASRSRRASLASRASRTCRAPLASQSSRASRAALASLAALTSLAALGCRTAESEPATGSSAGAPAPRAGRATPTAAAGPVVLELFTSQGCSSCPPADRLLSELIAGGRVGERAVIPMSFHVDYWNDLGWADPFSLAGWSQRQRQYAEALGERGVYTPQLVIGGRAHLVGSERRKLASAIAAAPPTRPLQVTATWSDGAVQVRASGARPGEELWLALWQDGLTTQILRGENHGEELRNDHVVRRLVALAADGTATVTFDPAWLADAGAAQAASSPGSAAPPRLLLGGAVLAQRSGDRAITAAAELPAHRPSPRR